MDKDLAGVGGCQVSKTDSELRKKKEQCFMETVTFIHRNWESHRENVSGCLWAYGPQYCLAIYISVLKENTRRLGVQCSNRTLA